MHLARHVCAAVLTAGLTVLATQAATPAKDANTAKAYAVPRTPDGQPDFEGYWNNGTYIPLERPKELGTKEFYTEAEALAIQKKNLQAEHTQSATDIHYDNVIWQGERFAKGAPDLRTSIVFDPPDGRLPPLSEEGQKRAAEIAAFARTVSPASPKSRGLGERCITWGADGPPLLGSTYNANVQIVQNGSSVVILTEMMHDARTVWLDGRPHIPANIHQLGGDSRGHWEGDTLVVDNIGFNEGFWMDRAGSPHTEKLHFVERFTRTDYNTLKYDVTVDDPGAYTAPFTSSATMRWSAGAELFEYVCQDNNYAPTLLVGQQESVDRTSVIVP